MSTRDSERPSSEEEELVHVGEMVAGKYRLDRRIARGGMGSVWAGWDTALDRAVAVKFMDPSIASSKILRERFQREARAAAGLRTPFVVQIFEHGVHGRVPFIVMELLEGEDLHDRLQRERRLSPQAVARILNQVARALRRAHDKGIVHRDLKPRNIFLARDEDEETVKILDFGIAKNLGQDTDGDTTKTGQVLGSLNYMSPEQARGFKDIDHRADLWSIAVILFRALCGRTLFSGQSSGDVIVKICTEPVPKITQLAPDLPEEFNAFFAKALDRDPAKRFPTAAELAVAFMELVRATRPAPGRVVAGGTGSPSVAPSGDWTPRSDLGTPFSDSQSYPSVDFGPSGAPGGTPPPVRSDSGLPSSPSGVAGMSAPSIGTGAPSGVDGPVGISASPAGPLTTPSAFDDTEAAVAGLASSARKRRSGAWAGLAVALVAVGGIAAWVLRGGGDQGEPSGSRDPTAPTVFSTPTDEAASAVPTAESAADDPGAAGSAEPNSSPDAPSAGPSAKATARPTTKTAHATTRKPREPTPAPTATASAKPKERWGY